MLLGEGRWGRQSHTIQLHLYTISMAPITIARFLGRTTAPEFYHETLIFRSYSCIASISPGLYFVRCLACWWTKLGATLEIIRELEQIQFSSVIRINKSELVFEWNWYCCAYFNLIGEKSYHLAWQNLTTRLSYDQNDWAHDKNSWIFSGFLLFGWILFSFFLLAYTLSVLH